MYLPTSVINHTVMPSAQGYDLGTAIKIIEEAWDRHFPKLPYYQVARSHTPAVNNIVSGAGASSFDTVYGEHVDPANTTWTQPHLSGATKAVDTEVYLEVVRIPIRVTRQLFDLALHKPGFDNVRTVQMSIPLSILDKFGVTVTAGDKFEWNGDEYIVMAPEEKGFWRNTNVRLYLSSVCEHKRRSSS